MRVKKILESFDFGRVILISVGYLLYIAFALYKKIGNETINILLISSTFLYLLIYIFIGREDELYHHRVKRKAKMTYKWVKRFIHVVNALYIVISIVFYHEEATPFTILFKYVTIVNFIVQLLASLFRFILQRQTDKMMVERKKIRRKKRRQRRMNQMNYQIVYGTLDEIDATSKKIVKSKEEFVKILKEMANMNDQRVAIYIGSFIDHETKFQQYIELTNEILGHKAMLVIFVQDIPFIQNHRFQNVLLEYIHPKTRKMKRKESSFMKEDFSLRERLLYYFDKKKMKKEEAFLKSYISFDKEIEDLNKNQIMAIAIQLHLTTKETNDLLSTINARLLESSRKDIIISFFQKKKIFDVREIEAYLYYFDCDSLFFYS